MKQQIKFESQELDGLAARADELCEWLNDEESAEGERQEVVNIPVHITVIASTALVYGCPSSWIGTFQTPLVGAEDVRCESS